jgi:hypothetical protein
LDTLKRRVGGAEALIKRTKVFVQTGAVSSLKGTKGSLHVQQKQYVFKVRCNFIDKLLDTAMVHSIINHWIPLKEGLGEAGGYMVP